MQIRFKAGPPYEVSNVTWLETRDSNGSSPLQQRASLGRTSLSISSIRNGSTRLNVASNARSSAGTTCHYLLDGVATRCAETTDATCAEFCICTSTSTARDIGGSWVVSRMRLLIWCTLLRTSIYSHLSRLCRSDSGAHRGVLLNESSYKRSASNVSYRSRLRVVCMFYKRRVLEPKTSSTWALIRRAFPQLGWAPAPSELSGWLNAAGELTGHCPLEEPCAAGEGGRCGAQCLFGSRRARACTDAGSAGVGKLRLSRHSQTQCFEPGCAAVQPTALRDNLIRGVFAKTCCPTRRPRPTYMYASHDDDSHVSVMVYKWMGAPGTLGTE